MGKDKKEHEEDEKITYLEPLYQWFPNAFHNREIVHSRKQSQKRGVLASSGDCSESKAESKNCSSIRRVC